MIFIIELMKKTKIILIVNLRLKESHHMQRKVIKIQNLGWVLQFYSNLNALESQGHIRIETDEVQELAREKIIELK